MNSCIFCQILKASRPLEIEDTILGETPNWFLKPALGALVPGYILAVSKRHIPSLSFATTKELEELECNIQTTQHHLSKWHSDFLLFEHGLCDPFRSAGSCIPHAHLHIVPTTVNLLQKLDDEFNWLPSTSLADLQKYYQTQQSYLYIRDADGKAACTVLEEIVQPQFLRKELASHLNIGQRWDWKEHPFTSNIQETISYYEQDHILL